MQTVIGNPAAIHQQGGSAAAVLTAGLVMAQLLPSLELTELSSRGLPDYAWSTEASLWPPDLLAVLMPLYGLNSGLMFDEQFFHVALPAVMLAGVALAGPGKRPLVWFWLAASLLALLAALGKYTPFYHLIWEYMPGAKYLRIPARFGLICQMALAVLAAVGAGRLLIEEGPERGRRLRLVCRVYLAVALAAAGALLWAIWRTPAGLAAAGHGDHLAEALGIFLALWLAGWLVLRLAAGGRLGGGAALGCLLFLFVVDMAFFPSTIMWGRLPAAERLPFSPILQFFRATTPPGRASFDGPLANSELATANSSLIYRIPTPGIHDTLDEYRHHELSNCGNPRIYADLRSERFIVSHRGPEQLPQNKYQSFELRPGESTELFLSGLFQGPLSRLGLVSHLAFAGLVKQNEPIAEILLYRGEDILARLPILAGVHSAEWSHDKHGQSYPHARPPVFSSFPVGKENYQGHYYLASWDLPGALAPDRLVVRRTGSNAFLKVDKILLNGRGLFQMGRRYRRLGPMLYQNQYWSPRTFAVHRWRVSKPGEPALHATGLLGDFQRECVLEREPVFPRAKPGPQPPSAKRARITRDDPLRVVVEADLAQPGILVLIDTWYPGWRVIVNGQRRPLLRADYAFRGVALAAGANRVEFIYQSLQLQRGMAFSGGTLILMILGSVVVVFWKRRRKSEAEDRS